MSVYPRGREDLQRAPFFSDYKRSRLIQSSPFRDVLIAADPYISHGWIFRGDPEAFYTALIKIVKDHENLTDSNILELLRFGGFPPEINLNKVVRALLGFSGDEHSYDMDLVIRLCFIALNTGKYDAMKTALFLIVPVRDDKTPQGYRLLIPDDEHARPVFERLTNVDRTLASAGWAKRLHHRIEFLSDTDVRRYARAYEIRLVLEGIYNDLNAECRARAMAAKDIGRMFLDPTVFGVNEGLARIWLKRAVSVVESREAAGERCSALTAAHLLGCLYAGRTGHLRPIALQFPENRTPEDIRNAIHYWHFAHTRHQQSGYELGRLYYLDPLSPLSRDRNTHVQNLGVDPDNRRAAYYFFTASGLGNRLSKIKYAEMLIYGTAHPPAPGFRLSLHEGGIHPAQRGDSADLGTRPEDEAAGPETGGVPTNSSVETRFNTLQYAEHVLRDLYDPVTKRLSIGPDHDNSPIWQLPTLIQEARGVASVRSRLQYQPDLSQLQRARLALA